MDKEQIKSEYEQLCKQAEQHNFNYYVLDDPTIEDDEYDRLMRRIKEIEAENPEIVSESPHSTSADMPSTHSRR